MKSKINEMYAQGLLTAGGIANAIASGWITDADAVSILGEEDGLAAAKTARIAQSKAALAAYLEAHPIQWTDGAYYAITADKQQQLASKIMAATMAQTLSADYRLTVPAGAAAALDAYNAAGSVPVEKKTKRGKKMLELKEYIPQVEYHAEGDNLVFALHLPAGDSLNVSPALLLTWLEQNYGAPAWQAHVLRTALFAADHQAFA